jgi:sulfur-oxidizing protein SoxY
MNRQRRIFLKFITGGSVTLVALASGLLTPQQVWAAWPKQAFEADNLDAALKALFEGAAAEESDAITLKAPDIAENGAVVPVSVQTELHNV